MNISRLDRQQGSATLLMLGFLSLLLVVLAVNRASVDHVRMDLRRIDREQQNFWHSSATNAPPDHPTHP